VSVPSPQPPREKAWPEQAGQALDQALSFWNDIRRSFSLEQPPDPRPPFPARRPRDLLDHAALPVLAIATAAMIALAIIGGSGAGIAIAVLLVLILALTVRQGVRVVSWQARRRNHRRAYHAELSQLYDRYRVEVAQNGQRVVLRMRRYVPSQLARYAAPRGFGARNLYRSEVVLEETFGPDDDIAAVERLTELQAEAEEREEEAREAYWRTADLQARAREQHHSAGELTRLLRDQLRSNR
jgi:hypothetical protein